MPDNAPSNPDNAPDKAAGQAPSPPPWGDDFDAEKAWRLIQNLRADNQTVKSKLAEYDKARQAEEDAKKSELQRALERAERAERALKEREAADQRAAALKAALKKHGLSDEDAELLEDVALDKLDERAQALAKRLNRDRQDVTETIPGKPAPKLTPGHEGPSKPTFDPDAIAARVLRRL